MKQILIQSATRLPALDGKVVAGGIVNALEALNMALRQPRKRPGGTLAGNGR